MIIKKIGVESIQNSSKEPVIQIIIKTDKGSFTTSAPSGESRGKYEAPPYTKDLAKEVEFLKNLKLPEIFNFNDLKKVEEMVYEKVGANSLFALEASILKALAKENKRELWQILEGKKKLPSLIGNAIGGGMHSKGINNKKPDFQEFLFIAGGKSIKECIEKNKRAYELARKLLNSKDRDDEGAWKTDKTDEEVLEIMNKIQETMITEDKEIVIGIDCAASSFYNQTYNYKNPQRELNQTQQIGYIKNLMRKYGLFYIEDPLEENDFSGFAEISKERCFIAGDDLTVTNPERLIEAIKMKSINAIIVKPNQIGSLLKVKWVIDIANKYNIKTIMSHRAGETKDDTIADLAVAWGCDFIKTGIYGKEREAKLNRLIKIEKSLKR